jgi:agmatine deiminase
MLVNGAEARASAQAALGHLVARRAVELFDATYGDIWLRDTAPIFTTRTQANVFGFNGWGGKYVYPGDDQVAAQVAALAGADVRRWPRVLEGGALDGDGEGTFLTTRECLLNSNRNRGMDADDYEAFLRGALGAAKLIWLGEGLMNDHTDGHVDNIARFVAPGVVVCQQAAGADDPNAARLDAIAAELAAARDARGRRLQVVRIPSPGLVLDDEGEIAPASHMNFIIGEASVVVPVYGTPSAVPAVAQLQKLFPGRDVVGSPARHILSGGGAFHCITQQQPA